ncbi:lipoprotein [Rhizobium sp. L1K21]|uniref:LPS translocon maturation chaperone LptM n=1 Tax=Rhizobium sp. L1K21 TaxID=2954933 RepID=UPI0020938D50|nr:lipoprotein [Rhizobium sp. L1K21]MCO6188175.1 lipoprotein [Rhizobium sp. L1K21]
MTAFNESANGKTMPHHLRKISVAVLIGVFAATALSGCGRKGDPEIPSELPATNNSNTAAPANNNNRVDDTPFVLDPLL